MRRAGQQRAKHRVAPELAAREVPGEAGRSAGSGALAALCSWRQTCAGRVSPRGATIGAVANPRSCGSIACGSVSAARCRVAAPRRARWWPAGRALPHGPAARGSTSSTHRLLAPRRAARGRRAAAGCRRPPCRASGAPARAAASRETVSKPRRVQLTSCRPRRCSTGSRNGLRNPAGARKQCGRTPHRSASTCCARVDLAGQRARPQQREVVAVRSGCGSARRGRARRSRARSAGCCLRVLGDAKEGGARCGAGRAGRARAA